MNEVTQIHLGRQAFTIAVDAHGELRTYLDDIQKQVGDAEVVEEVELRMAELLAEHGINDEKVILPGDVSWLKEQLGEPRDFKEEDDEVEAENKPGGGKRLFRDTENGILAGVAAGLASYSGISVSLIRILFVISVIAGGWGILLYVLLWLLIPEARTSSDRLRMAGKAVTVDSLKSLAERADVKGAAQRVNNSLAGPINSIFRVILKLIGLTLVIVGLALLFAFIAMESYVLVHSGNLFGQDIFPVGFREHLLLNLGATVIALISILIVIFGLAIFKQNWPIKTWVTGTLVGLTLIGLAGVIALGADTGPNIRDRYDASFHQTTQTVPAFNQLRVEGGDMGIHYAIAPTYSVSMKYYDHPDTSKIKISVQNDTLTIDARQFDPQRHCDSLCIPQTYDMVITISSPTIDQIGSVSGVVVKPGVPLPEPTPVQP